MNIRRRSKHQSGGRYHRIRVPWAGADSTLRARGLAAAFTSLVVLLSVSALLAHVADEYTGKFEGLAPNTEDTVQAVFRPAGTASGIKFASPPEAGAYLTAGRLFHPLSGKLSVMAVLVEPEKQDPYIYADLDANGVMDESERFLLKATDNPNIWQTSVSEALKDGPFPSFPILVQYYKNTRNSEMVEGDRLVLETKTAFATGFVDIQGKKTLVEYDYDPRSKRINPALGKQAVDTNGDGVIDLDRFSPEFAEANNEEVVFRAGNAYVSTKKVDVEKNLIVMRSRSASDYRRVELLVGAEMPDFEFVDFAGKKRRFSEFRGKCVLIDFWGMWCPACREELPYLKAAYAKFQPKGFEILGLDTDETQNLSQVEAILQKSGMNWTQARRESILHVIVSLRISLFPTSILIGKDGKIISLDNAKKGQPDLRGEDLIQSLSEVLR
jgi:thiol-disulfide isomerase/thioredoxin